MSAFSLAHRSIDQDRSLRDSPELARAGVLTPETKEHGEFRPERIGFEYAPEDFSPLERLAQPVSEILHTQVTRIFIPQLDSKAAEFFTPIRPERRRTPRSHIPIPLFVYGHTPEGQPFYEEAFTSAVNVHGGSMRMEMAVQLGQRLLVTNQKNECELPCIIVFVGARLGGGTDVAFSFTAAMPYFWRPLRCREISGEEVDWDYLRSEL